MTYTEVTEYLNKASLRGSILGLSRIKLLLEKLGNPQNKLQIIHVSGTNGKGSFSAMLSCILTEAGFKTGGFSSPAITQVNDSFRINCKTVSDEDFAEILTEVIEKAEEIPEPPTEFEILTAAAFLMFYKNACDYSIIECGLGGDGDSTNVVEKTVLSVITNVQKDHCGILGNTIEEIAVHKSGIIKKDCPVLYGGDRNEAFDVIYKKAESLNSEIFVTEHDRISNAVYNINGTAFDFHNKHFNLSLLGMYQKENAANVLTAVEILRKNNISISDDAVKIAFEKCRWHGRFELLSENPVIIFDGSHNPQGMEYTVKSINEYFSNQKVALLMGVMADKEYSLYPSMLKNIADKVFTVTPDNSRSLKAETLCKVFTGNGINGTAYSDFSQGVRDAVKYAEEKNIPLIAMGTLYMYNDFINEIKKMKISL